MSTKENNIGIIIKQLRVSAGPSRAQLGFLSGLSESYLSRIENGRRVPSAKALRIMAPHLHIDEMELLTLAGYVLDKFRGMSQDKKKGSLDPYEANLLSMETAEVQRAVVSILYMVKYVAEGLSLRDVTGKNEGQSNSQSPMD